MENRKYLLVSLLLILVTSFVQAQSVPVYIKVMDAVTHFGFQASVEFNGPETVATGTNKYGRATVHLLPGEYQEKVTAPGYKPMMYQFTVLPGESTVANGRDVRYPTGGMLEPIKRPKEMEEANKLIRPGYTVVAGYAVDDHNQPVADVHIHLQGKSVEPVDTTTNYNGFYVMSVPSPPGTAMVPSPRNPGDYLPGTANLTAEKSGYKTQVYTNIPLINGQPSGLFVEMQRGSGTVETDVPPAWLNGTGGTCIGEHACDDIDTTPNHLKPKPDREAPVPPHAGSPKREKAPVSLGSIIPPDTEITVGTSCPTPIVACSPTSQTCNYKEHPNGCPVPTCSQPCSGTYGPVPFEQYGLRKSVRWHQRGCPKSG
jgi:hypothetical protein